ncbi:MAG: DNA alkylation repair protein [Pirellulaceae bacterium]|nr:DNA alkylation repair protein [Pirellulaceae bacterium]
MTGFSLKDHLFNRAKVDYLAGLFTANDPAFAKREFVNQVMKALPSLELKQRIALIAEALEDHLSEHFPTAVAQIVASLPPPLDESRTDDDFGDFIFAPLGEYVVRKGATRTHLALSLSTLKELTKRFSMEDAMRTFIRQFPSETIRELTRWAKDRNYHVRRLVSESTRPLLPWSGRIDLPVETTLPLLDVLHSDRTRYVTRSVANHLNDIAKSNPELVVQALQKWHVMAKQERQELLWMTRHALRTLVKRGHADALRLLGLDPAPKLSIGAIQIAKRKLLPGDSLEFSLEITALRDECLVIDYAIEFVKAGGKRSTKVFKAAKLSLKQGESRTVYKKHKLHAQATTYQLYAGEHQLTVQINGQAVGTKSFHVT